LCLDVIDETGLCEKYSKDIEKLLESQSTKSIEINVMFVIKGNNKYIIFHIYKSFSGRWINQRTAQVNTQFFEIQVWR